MIDAAHTIGADLSVSPTGDIALSSGTQAGQERVLRRLLTNPGDYIWQLSYGGGIAAMIGNPADALAIRGIIAGQMSKEDAVSQNPLPVVTVSVDDSGVVSASIQYVDADTGQNTVLTLPGG